MMIHFISGYQIVWKSVQWYSRCLHSDWQTNMVELIGPFCYLSLRMSSKMNTKKANIKKKEKHKKLRARQGGNEMASPFCSLLARNPWSTRRLLYHFLRVHHNWTWPWSGSRCIQGCQAALHEILISLKITVFWDVKPVDGEEITKLSEEPAALIIKAE